jgi:CPA2 family monovalent cation:H+ antiporter-2
MIEIARILNPGIDTVVRTHSEEEAEFLRQERVGQVFMGEQELAAGMMVYVQERLGAEGPAPRGRTSTEVA